MQKSNSTQQFGTQLSDYEIMGQLGRGATAFVYKVRCRQFGGIYALKVVDKENLREKNLVQRIKQEIQVHRQLKCPRIIELHSYFEDEQNVYILMENFEGQELYHFVKQLPKSSLQILPEKEVAHLVRQIAEGLSYMQEKNIMHRDLKLSNVLISENRELKIIDFGLAVQLSDPDEERQTLCGTPNYISPEVILNKSYGLQTDMWSLGCIMYALLTGTPPFECPTVQDTLMKIKLGTFQDIQGSSQMKDLLSKLLVQQPDQRLSVTEVLKHKWLAKELQSSSKKREDLSYLMLDFLTIDPLSTETKNSQFVIQTPGFNIVNLNGKPHSDEIQSANQDIPLQYSSAKQKQMIVTSDNIKRKLQFEETLTAGARKLQFEETLTAGAAQQKIPVVQTKKQKTKNQIKIKTETELAIDTRLMAPFRHNMAQDESGNSYLKLNEKGNLTLYLAKLDKFIEISQDGLTVSLDQKNFQFGKLPKKLQNWYTFGKQAVGIIKSRTPFIILKSGKTQGVFSVMMLDRSIEIQLPDCVVRQSPNRDRKIDLEEFQAGGKRVYEIDIVNDLEGVSQNQRSQCEVALRAIKYLKQKVKEVEILDYRELPLTFKVKQI